MVRLGGEGIPGGMLAMSNTVLPLISDRTLRFRTYQRAEEVRRGSHRLRGECLTEMQGVLVSIDLIAVHVLLGPSVYVAREVPVTAL